MCNDDVSYIYMCRYFLIEKLALHGRSIINTLVSHFSYSGYSNTQRMLYNSSCKSLDAILFSIDSEDIVTDKNH